MRTLLDREKLVFSPPELGCVLCLPGLPGGGTKLYDRSPYGNTGTITGATWKRLPSGLWYLDFDGVDDNVDFGAPTSHLASNITVLSLEAWVQTNDTSARQGITSGGAERTVEWQLSGGLLKVDGKNSSYAWAGLNFNTGLTDNDWHHVAVTFSQSRGTGILFIDGKNINSQSKTDDFIAVSNLYVGYLNPVAGTVWDGGIALLRIYNRALNALEIQNHFNRGKHLFGVW